jgi:hypothetical protein
MIDFEPVRSRQITLTELAAQVSAADLRSATMEMIARMQALIETCRDADIDFQPNDPEANDPHALTPNEVHMAWTLGHIVVHATASAEEAAALAAELARGVPYHGRSRYETHWLQMTTIAQCRERLNESCRMRLASLEMWPSQPHLDNLAEIIPGRPPVNAIGRFLMGLMHDDAHLTQLAEVVRQAHAQ